MLLVFNSLIPPYTHNKIDSQSSQNSLHDQEIKSDKLNLDYRVVAIVIDASTIAPIKS